jgi:hypothetical protein
MESSDNGVSIKSSKELILVVCSDLLIYLTLELFYALVEY